MTRGHSRTPLLYTAKTDTVLRKNAYVLPIYQLMLLFTVVEALMRVQLETDTPVFSMVLTPHHFRSEEPVHAFFAQHLIAKGEEVADACVRMAGCLARLGVGMSPEAARHLAARRVVERFASAVA